MAELYLHNPHTDDFDLFSSIEELCKEMDRSAWVFKACFGESKTEFLDFIREEMGEQKSRQLAKISELILKVNRPLARYVNSVLISEPYQNAETYSSVIESATNGDASAVNALAEWFAIDRQAVPFDGFGMNAEEAIYWKNYTHGQMQCLDIIDGGIIRLSEQKLLPPVSRHRESQTIEALHNECNSRSHLRGDTTNRSRQKPDEIRILRLPGGAEMEMIHCPPGEFMMGSPVGERGRHDCEELHRVILHGFWLGKYPVTQWQCRSVMGSDHSRFQKRHGNRPVENVSWYHCQAFIKMVNEYCGCVARLPTEAEWEYACRAGTTSSYNIGNMLNYHEANCAGHEDVTTDVGKYEANAWGFYDMHGNVWEWCSDIYDCDYYKNSPLNDPQGPRSGNLRVVRGGSWRSRPVTCRSASRGASTPNSRIDEYGFRLCCSMLF